ncbi:MULTISPECIES: HlyD family secretion protein [Mesorhizobium]|uniref:HlyD family efflux transporter periplasmic adaptor subunit n=1 Tax=Mesorhizobium denitrificans TaxID=2294114 RepID=A0A371XIF6_9HYPH|nr:MULTISPECIES: HlyD family efflux transporter periplasmic adaptor subunit [Mesorhizobium]RFC68824.1 HlyD family efflux transporter periplasmic adaptor subunit [Mesorhizobium denitrificans]
MKKLRNTIRIDNLGKQQRAASAKWGRRVYLTMIAGFVTSLLYYLFGSIFVLSADGIILTSMRAVDASYTGKIVDVYVQEGDLVEEGMPLLKLESFEMVKEIAELALRDGELAVRESQLRGQLDVVEAIAPLAARNARESTKTVSSFDKVSDRGVISVLSRDSALQSSFAAAQKVAELTAQKSSAQDELEQVGKSRQTSREAMEKLKAIFDDGNIRASGPGVIGVKVPVPGQVVKPGDELLQINGGKIYVLAYLPDEYMFAIRKGMTVNLRSGGETAKGRIDSVLAVADALPDEFQNLFRPRDRSRLFRVVLTSQNPFAVTQKVTVTGCAFGFCWAG